MSFALYASPIDYKTDVLENKLREEKSKLNRESLMKQLKTEPQSISDTSIPFSVATVSEIHKNLKDDNDAELSNFYKSEMENYIPPPPIKRDNQFMLMDNQMAKVSRPSTNDGELLKKLNKMIEMFEEQKEIKTTKKNEEIVLYCFLGVFTIYILDSFASIGRYSR